MQRRRGADAGVKHKLECQPCSLEPRREPLYHVRVPAATATPVPARNLSTFTSFNVCANSRPHGGVRLDTFPSTAESRSPTKSFIAVSFEVLRTPAIKFHARETDPILWWRVFQCFALLHLVDTFVIQWLSALLLVVIHDGN
jgi:hypothetical protein